MNTSNRHFLNTKVQYIAIKRLNRIFQLNNPKLKYDETKNSIPKIGILNLNKNKAPISYSESILKVVLAPEPYRLHPFEENHILNKRFESILIRANSKRTNMKLFAVGLVIPAVVQAQGFGGFSASNFFSDDDVTGMIKHLN